MADVCKEYQRAAAEVTRNIEAHGKNCIQNLRVLVLLRKLNSIKYAKDSHHAQKASVGEIVAHSRLI